MFCRRWSGLPADRAFPADFKQLGYFINEDDEIRSRADENFYFKFFLTKNDRVNLCQRFAFNSAVEKEVHARIEALGLEKIPLPLGATDLTKPHVPIFASRDIGAKKRVVVVFGEPCQDLGILALRVMNGKGGVDQGSMVSLIKHIQLFGKNTTTKDDPGKDGAEKSKSGDDDGNIDENDIGIVLANTGQTYWWPEGRRAVSPHGVLGLPLPSAVHYGRAYDVTANAPPGNSTPDQHVDYMFDTALPSLLRADARIAVVAISQGAHLIGASLGNDEARWARWAGRVAALAMVGGCMDVRGLSGVGFKEFLARRARAYVWSKRPQGTLLAGSQGNPKMRTFTSYGCPVFASGEPGLDEMILIVARDLILDWVLGALTTPGGYCNPVDVSLPSVTDLPADEVDDEDGDDDDGDGNGDDDECQGEEDGTKEKEKKKKMKTEWNWDAVPDEAKPEVLVLKDPEMQRQLEELDAWDEFKKTGHFPAPPDSDDD